MSYKEIRENGFFGASIDNTGEYERPSFGVFTVRKNSLHLAATKEDFTVKDTVEGRKAAAAAMEKGMLVFDLGGNLLTADDLTEKE